MGRFTGKRILITGGTRGMGLRRRCAKPANRPDQVRKQFEGKVVSQLALRRMGASAEAAAVALFLLSDDASYVTGSQYAVDGGLTMR